MRKIGEDLPQVAQQEERNYYGPPRPKDYSADELAQAAREMQAVLSGWPRLAAWGFLEPHTLLREYGAAADETFQRERERMLSPNYLAAFLATRAWLRRNAAARKTPNPYCTSYGMKHVAERDVGYITNGVFIAAAVAERFMVKQEKSGRGRGARLEINARINIDLPTVRRRWRTRDWW